MMERVPLLPPLHDAAIKIPFEQGQAVFQDMTRSAIDIAQKPPVTGQAARHADPGAENALGGIVGYRSASNKPAEEIPQRIEVPIGSAP